MSQIVYLGGNSIQRIEEILAKENPSSIFLVTGRKSYETSGAKDKIDSLLEGRTVTHFYDFDVNPKLEDIEKGIALYREGNCDFVIAIGGGSAIDIAKSINVLQANQGTPRDYIEQKLKPETKGSKLVAIPTTSGSGSEATHFAVAYIDKTKYSLAKDFMLPDYVIADFELTMNLPAAITASTGMDALCQGIESYWCVNSTDESKQYAAEAIKLAYANLREAVNNPNLENREAMMKAAHLAGKAINISQTTASHAISYPITSFFGAPHGHAVALTIGKMVEYNDGVSDDDVLDSRKTSYVKQSVQEIVSMLDASSVSEAQQNIEKLMKDIGLATHLRDLGIKESDLSTIISNGFNPQRVKNNPRLVTEDAMRKILEELL